MTTEKGYQNEVVRWAGKRGWLVRKIRYEGRLGALDLMLIRKGVVVFIEMKQGGGTLSYHQKKERTAIYKAGGHAYAAFSAAQAKEILKAHEDDGTEYSGVTGRKN